MNEPSEPKPAGPGPLAVSVRSWGWMLLIGGLLFSIAASYEGMALGAGFLTGALVCLPSYLCLKNGRRGAGIALFLLSFAACTGVASWRIKSSPSMRRALNARP